MTIKLDEYEPIGPDPLVHLAYDINKNAHDKGFYEDPRSFAEAVALIHSEVSEALEEDRAGRTGLWFQRRDGVRFLENGVYVDPRTGLVYDQPDGPEQGHPPLKPEGRDVELLDAMIRILDTLAENVANVDFLVKLKTAYNASRGHKHGKAY